jgi:chromate transport protein ChrA
MVGESRLSRAMRRATMAVWVVGVALLFVNRDTGVVIILVTVFGGELGRRRWGWRWRIKDRME